MATTWLRVLTPALVSFGHMAWPQLAPTPPPPPPLPPQTAATAVLLQPFQSAQAANQYAAFMAAHGRPLPLAPLRECESGRCTGWPCQPGSAQAPPCDGARAAAAETQARQLWRASYVAGAAAAGGGPLHRRHAPPRSGASPGGGSPHASTLRPTQQGTIHGPRGGKTYGGPRGRRRGGEPPPRVQLDIVGALPVAAHGGRGAGGGRTRLRTWDAGVRRRGSRAFISRRRASSIPCTGDCALAVGSRCISSAFPPPP